MKKLPNFDAMLSHLVSEPSVSSVSPDIDRSNLRVLEHLANWLDGLGFATELMPLPNRPDKANLMATLGSGPGGLVLAGHTDTVPCDEALWESDPFAIKETDTRYYGLGSCDMKGFFPVALQAAAAIDAKKLVAPITLIATSDEESSMAGGRYLLEQGRPKADYAIIGEPTGLKPIFAHKGVAMLTISVQGASGHSSDPSLGSNALDAMHAIMQELINLRLRLSQTFNNPHFDVAEPTLNLGCLHAGDNPNRICGHAELQFDLRLLPGMDADIICGDIEKIVAVVGERHGVVAKFMPIYPPIPAFETPQSSALLQTLSNCSGQTGGTVAFGTEAHFYQSLGMETIVFGPGSIDQAHQPNEYLPKEQVEAAQQALITAIQRFCMQP
ncbi:MAG TPA: acetylornithine deacetylase [Gammaproteobacteria bacterium]|nr:acetylornithine deacetylase [Gammaproteobacteria bacterium]|tara:strand:+ start:134 stop:1288 length:1155 start_codon:yes stop_codon:yes gene_type:complete